MHTKFFISLSIFLFIGCQNTLESMENTKKRGWLHDSASEEDFKRIKKPVFSSSESSFELDSQEDITFGHFMDACRNGKAKTIKKYIKAGFSPASFVDNTSLLNEALKIPCEKGVRLVGYLLRAGVGIGPSSDGLPGWTAFHDVVYDGSTEYARLILDQYPSCIDDEITGSSRAGETALHLAAQNRNEELVFLLLQRGASAKVCDTQGRSPLHDAIVAHASVGLLQQLVNANADIHKATRLGLTPLHIAAEHNNPAAAELLLKNNANVNVQKQITAPSLIKEGDSDSPDKNQLLVYSAQQLCDNFGEEIEAENQEGWTPLHLAVRYTNYEVAKKLLEGHARIDIKDGNNISPLALALKGRDGKLIEALLFKGYPVFDTLLQRGHLFNLLSDFPKLSFAAQRDLWRNANQELQIRILESVCMSHYRYIKSVLEEVDKALAGVEVKEAEAPEQKQLDSYLSQIRDAQLWIDCPKEIQHKIQSNIRKRLV